MSYDGQRAKCDICGAVAGSSQAATRLGWDWFTGTMPKTFHVCQRCKKTHAKMIDGKRVAAGMNSERPVFGDNGEGW